MGSLHRALPFARVGLAWVAFLGLVVVAASLSIRTPGDVVHGVGGHFDSGYYLEIADGGYRDDPHEEALIGFLPGYSIAMAGLSAATGLDLFDAGVAVSAAAGLVAAVALWVLAGAVGVVGRARTVALLVWLAYPFGFFQYGAVYSESLFAALAVGAFVAVERDRRGLAATLAAFATIVRPTGIPLVAGLVVLSLERGGALEVVWARTDGRPRWRPTLRADRARVRARLLVPALGLGGLVAFFVYCGVRWGRPFVYFESENSLNAPFTLETFSKVHFVSSLRQAPDQPLVAVSLVASAALVIGVIATAPAVARRFGAGYAVYVLGVVALMWVGQANFASAGRYMMLAFPTMLLAGEWLAERPTRVVAPTVVVSTALMLGNALAYGHATGYPGW